MGSEPERLNASSTQPKACFILSAGRTGTLFLARLLEQRFPEALAVHEPFPARFELVLANLRNDTGLGEAMLRWLFGTARRRCLDKLGGRRSYIELNPLLCPLTDLLPELPIPLNVVHLVREPGSWARSITAFRASTFFRPFIDSVPLAKPYPHPRPAGWSGLGELERAIWRWRFCNERILALRPRCQNYAIVRYEDLFSESPNQRATTLHNLLSQLPIDFDGDISSVDMSTSVNPAPRAILGAVDKAAIQSICGDLMPVFGYGD